MFSDETSPYNKSQSVCQVPGPQSRVFWCSVFGTWILCPDLFWKWCTFQHLELGNTKVLRVFWNFLRITWLVPWSTLASRPHGRLSTWSAQALASSPGASGAECPRTCGWRWRRGGLRPSLLLCPECWAPLTALGKISTYSLFENCFFGLLFQKYFILLRNSHSLKQF